MKIKFCFVLFCVFLFWGCNKSEKITFDNSEPLSLLPDISWAVISNPYVAFQKEASWNSEITFHARKGEIFQVLGKSVNSQNESWYKFDKGFLNNSVIQVYSNRLKAEKAAKLMEKL